MEETTLSPWDEKHFKQAVNFLESREYSDKLNHTESLYGILRSLLQLYNSCRSEHKDGVSLSIAHIFNYHIPDLVKNG